MQDHVIRSRARCAQDRRPGPVPSERDAGAAIAPAEGGEPLVAEARRIARRDGSDRVPMLEPHERGGQASRGEGLDDLGRRRLIEVQPSGFGGSRDAVESLLSQDIELGHREKVRSVRLHRSGEQDRLRDPSGSLHDRLHRGTVAISVRARQAPVDPRFGFPSISGTTSRVMSQRRRRAR